MKITFLVPPPIDGKIPERVAGCAYLLYYVPNIFLLSAAAVLEKAGYEVRYIETTIKKWQRGHFLAYLKEDLSDVYCFYSVNLSQETDIHALNDIRNLRGYVPVIFFGPAPSDRSAEFVVDNDSYVVRGEPEYTMVELLKALHSKSSINGIKSVSFMNNGEIIHNVNRELIEDLDSLPFPARHLIEEREVYYNPKLGKRPFTAVCTSRGCSYRCIYCVPSSLSFSRELEYKHYLGKKPPVRKRSPENIIEEFKLLKAQGYKAMNIQDDQFVWGEERTVRICEGIKDLDIVWGCSARSDHLNEPIVKAMAEANCKFIDLGVESFSQEILDYVRKDIDVKKNEEAIKLVKKYGISAKINIMIGASPIETMDTIKKNMEEVKRLKVDQVMYNIANPFPGTDFYKIAKDNKLFVYGDYKPVNVAKEANIAYPHLSKKDLEDAVRRANFEFFLTPRFIIKNIRRLGSLDSLKAMFKKLF
ncbi:MAG TPA: B12-binding domain-containing radical SAM protein [Candidatus Wujingus californicus]|uniref:B12-binding domain-containing radical SAM protein n=2 Tax=Candidatus Wujingus californicus TaxID=3367618 RepID=UPI001DFBE410|nr:radical SAM protein [Planctomycetota bacterium]MDO8130982.1 B12-binding domain-containing radical SAM protein [Candidatus Brocadiales bacterium]